MLTLIEALRFRCLKYVRQPLDPFHVLVGPNASGKTTFLDTIAFLGRLVSDGLEAAINDRTQDFRDLVWQRSEGNFELAVEARIPDDRRKLLADKEMQMIRYEVSVGPDPESNETSLLGERVLLRRAQPATSQDGHRSLFPAPPLAPDTILRPKASKGTKTVVNKVRDGNDNFYDETGRGWDQSLSSEDQRS